MIHIVIAPADGTRGTCKNDIGQESQIMVQSPRNSTVLAYDIQELIVDMNDRATELNRNTVWSRYDTVSYLPTMQYVLSCYTGRRYIDTECIYTWEASELMSHWGCTFVEPANCEGQLAPTLFMEVTSANLFSVYITIREPDRPLEIVGLGLCSKHMSIVAFDFNNKTSSFWNDEIIVVIRNSRLSGSDYSLHYHTLCACRIVLKHNKISPPPPSQ